MKIAISLNDVIRDFSKNLQEKYDLYCELNDEQVKYLVEGDDEVYDYSEEITNDYISKNSLNILKKYLKNLNIINDEKADDFLLNDYVFEIYGKCEEVYHGAMNDLNIFYNILINQSNECTIISQEKENSKIATFQFLSKNRCMANNYKFLDNYDNVWDIYDVIITADKDIINNYNLLPADIKNDKTIFIILNGLNEDISNDNEYKYNSFRDLLNTYKKFYNVA